MDDTVVDTVVVTELIVEDSLIGIKSDGVFTDDDISTVVPATSVEYVTEVVTSEVWSVEATVVSTRTSNMYKICDSKIHR